MNPVSGCRGQSRRFLGVGLAVSLDGGVRMVKAVSPPGLCPASQRTRCW